MKMSQQDLDGSWGFPRDPRGCATLVPGMCHRQKLAACWYSLSSWSFLSHISSSTRRKMLLRAAAVSLWARGLERAARAGDSSVTVGLGTLLELDAAGCPGCSCTHCSARRGLWPDPEAVAWGSTCVAPLPCASWRAAGSSQDLPPEHRLLVAAGTVWRDTQGCGPAQLGLCLA